MSSAVTAVHCAVVRGWGTLILTLTLSLTLTLTLILTLTVVLTPGLWGRRRVGMGGMEGEQPALKTPNH